MAKRVGLERLQALLEGLNRTLNLQDSDLTIGILSGSTVSASAFVGDGSGLTGIAGGGSPGGSDTQVQFNSGSSFGGSSNLTFDYSSGTNQLKVVGAISGSSTLHAEGAATFSSTIAATSSISASSFYDTTLGTTVGNVTGVDSMTDRSLIVANGTTGKAITGSFVTMDLAGNISAPGQTFTVDKLAAGGSGVTSNGPISGAFTLHAEGAATFSSTVAATGSVTAVGLYSTGPISGSTTLHAEGAATFSSTVAVTSSVTADSFGHSAQASGSISENDIVVAVGYTGTTMKVQKAHAMVLSHARGPFYVASAAASDGDTFKVVSSKLVTGIDTSAANSIGDALYLASGSSGSVFFGEVPLATADEAHFALAIIVGRVVSVDGSNGAYLLTPPVVNTPLVGSVLAASLASTQVVGFGSAYATAQVVAVCSTDPPPGDDDQIKSAFIVESGTYEGNLQITMDHSDSGARLSYAIYI